MLTEENDRVIVRSTIELAHNLGLAVVAERVETEAVWRELCTLGCDVGQGFHLGSPLPEGSLLTWLEARRRSGRQHAQPPASTKTD